MNKRLKLGKLGELFCGAGGFAEGARKAGFEHVWATDHHRESCKTFENNQNCKVLPEEIDEFVKTLPLRKSELVEFSDI